MNPLLQIFLFLLLLAFGALLMGMALTPELVILMTTLSATEGWTLWARAFCIGISVMIGYFLYGFTLMVLIVLFSKLIPKPDEGAYPYFLPQQLNGF